LLTTQPRDRWQALLDFVRSPTSASLLSLALELLLAMLGEANTRQLVYRWEVSLSECRPPRPLSSERPRALRTLNVRDLEGIIGIVGFVGLAGL